MGPLEPAADSLGGHLGNILESLKPHPPPASASPPGRFVRSMGPVWFVWLVRSMGPVWFVWLVRSMGTMGAVVPVMSVGTMGPVDYFRDLCDSFEEPYASLAPPPFRRSTLAKVGGVDVLKLHR